MYIQILTCNNELGSCCSNSTLVSILNLLRMLVELIQIVIPILLLVMLTVQLIKLVINPDDKQKLKKMVISKLIAAVIFFTFPLLINLGIDLIPERKSFELASCWKVVKDIHEIQNSSNSQYVREKEKKTKLIEKTDSPKTTSAGSGSEIGVSIVNYALKFVGKKYVYEGTWDGESPYSPTDSAGFVQGVYKHHGINLSNNVSSIWNEKSKYYLINPNNIQAGDLVMYTGHVAILTGNGNEIVHAANGKLGVIVTPNYHYSDQAILGIMRIRNVY